MKTQLIFFLLLFSLNLSAQERWKTIFPQYTFELYNLPQGILCEGDTVYYLYTFMNDNIQSNQVAMELMALNNGFPISTDTLYETKNDFSNVPAVPNIIYHPDFGLIYGINGSLPFEDFYYFGTPRIYPTKQPLFLNYNDSITQGLIAFNLIKEKIIVSRFTRESDGNYSEFLFGNIFQNKRTIYRVNTFDKRLTGIYENKLDEASFFFTENRVWKYQGQPQAWRTDIIKMDTNGNKIWTAKIPIGDSFNTSFTTLLQKDNGNLIVSFNDNSFNPDFVPLRKTDFANDNRTIWFLEIDYLSGEVLWMKNITDYLNKKLPFRMDPWFKQIKYLNNYKSIITPKGEFIWLYQFHRPDLINGFKESLVLLKTDQDANPIWMREIIAELDDPLPGISRGARFYSIDNTPDGGFVVAGEKVQFMDDTYEYYGQPMVLKLDSFGCLEEGCQLRGCTDPKAYNYDSMATADNGLCIMPQCEEGFIELEIYSGGNSFTRMGGRNNTVTITGMNDQKVYLNKKFHEMAQTKYPNTFGGHSEDTLLYDDIYEVVCLPNTGQCYRISMENISLRINFRASGIYDYKVLLPSKDAQYFEIFVKDGKLHHESCIMGEIIPPKPPPLPDEFDTCQIQVFPNPNDGTFQIACINNGFLDEIDYEIRDVQGRIIKSEVNAPLPHHINANHLASGLYFITLNSKKINYHETHKIIIQH